MNIDLQRGGYYASREEGEEQFEVFRLLNFNRYIYHVAIFKEKFAGVPSLEDVMRLSPYIGHAPIDSKVLLRESEIHLLGGPPLTEEDLEDYRIYLEHHEMGEKDIKKLFRNFIGHEVPRLLKVTLALKDGELEITKRGYSFLDEQDDVINDPLNIGVDEEESKNTWCLGMSSERARTTPTAELVHFLEAVVQDRDRQLRARYGNKHPMLFYCWVDEMAGQLRFSLISGENPRPPFGCDINIVSNSTIIVEQFLHLTTLDGIPWSELHEVSPDEEEDEEEPPRYVLDVWTQQLPINPHDHVEEAPLNGRNAS